MSGEPKTQIVGRKSSRISIAGFRVSDYDTPRMAALLIGNEFNYRPGPKFNIFWIPMDSVPVTESEMKKLGIEIDRTEDSYSREF